MCSGSAPRSAGHSAFVAEVKRSLPPEKSAELFQTISCYKKTDNYDNLVVKVLGLFKDNVNLLASKFTPTVRCYTTFESFHFESFLKSTFSSF